MRGLFVFLCTFPLCIFFASCSPAKQNPVPQRVALNPTLKLDFAAIDTRTGTPVTLGNSLNKITMVHFWATWCPQCLEELRSLQSMYAQIDHNSFELIAVALASNEEKIKELTQRFSLQFKIWSDQSGASQQAFSAASLPYTAILNTDGKALRFLHPQTKTPVAAVSGAAVWDTPQAIDSVKKLIANN